MTPSTGRSRSSWTLLLHGAYVSALALILVLAPGVVRLFLAFPTEFDWWNRALAVPIFNLGIFCMGAALTGSRALIQLSVVMRLGVMTIFAILVALRLVPSVALAVGIIDLLSAALTAWALKVEAAASGAV